MCLVVVCAAASKAASNCVGNVRPRFSARRRIPAQARGLKQYRSRCGPLSKMRDKEHTLAPLRQAEELSVERSVGEPVPEFLKSGQETGERMDFVCVILVLDHNGFPEASVICRFVAGSRIGRHSTFRRTWIGSVVGSCG